MSRFDRKMRYLAILLTASASNITPLEVQAQTKATVQLPACLNFKGNGTTLNTWVPCTGVIPVGADGNPSSWSDIGKGSPEAPGFNRTTELCLGWDCMATSVTRNITYD